MKVPATMSIMNWIRQQTGAQTVELTLLIPYHVPANMKMALIWMSVREMDIKRAHKVKPLPIF